MRDWSQTWNYDGVGEVILATHVLRSTKQEEEIEHPRQRWCIYTPSHDDLVSMIAGFAHSGSELTLYYLVVRVFYPYKFSLV